MDQAARGRKWASEGKKMERKEKKGVGRWGMLGCTRERKMGKEKEKLLSLLGIQPEDVLKFWKSFSISYIFLILGLNQI
jgi:hypothetical protein